MSTTIFSMSEKRFTKPPLPHLSADLLAGTVVFLVALPLCLGIALASGVPLLAGLVSGVVGGLVVASLSGSQLSVSGPAAGLVVIVIDAIATLGSFSAFLVAVTLAGVFQVVLGFLRAGNLGACFPASVIKGMLAAIGIVLIVKQLPVALGLDLRGPLFASGLSLAPLWNAMATLNTSVVLIAGVSLAILVVWETPGARRFSWVRKMPAALVVVVWGVAYQMVAVALGGGAALSDRYLVNLPDIEGWTSLWQQLAAPDWSALQNSKLFMVAASLAVVASLESILSLEATEQLDPRRQVAPPNRELKAQGVGNIVAGLLGGLPITAVIVRSSANVNAGARTKTSAIFHGLLLLVSVLFLASALQWIPLAALATILIHTGYKLAKPSLFAATWRQGWASFVPFAITVATILATDLLVGILMGLACSVLYAINAQARSAVSITSRDGMHLLRFRKDATFLSKATMREYLGRVSEGESLIIDGARCKFVDRDIRDLLQDFMARASARRIRVELVGLPTPLAAAP